ncbi:MAG: LytTR family transcriptional regulator DNA-binding domain-containing protein [Ruminococcus sp.]
MLTSNYITITSQGKKVVLSVGTILYVFMVEKVAEIHIFGGKVYKTRMTLSKLEEELGECFIKVHRGCIVSAMAIHDIADNINLINGESLTYTIRKKKQIIDRFHSIQKNIISGFAKDGIPQNHQEYANHYSGFENMPFAFTDIEMVFDEEKRAVDWIFRYGNPALAKLEKLPLESLMGSSFSSLFSNMDPKWLRCYERATLYGEKLEMIDFSPEIDTYIKVICFPTFKGHCGCILFDISEIKFIQNSSDAPKALDMYLNFNKE